MGLKIGYAPGAFDLFHIGHLNILKHAKSQCDYLIAGVVSDEILEQVKGRLPLVPLAERMEIVGSIGYVDKVFAEVVPDKLQVWEELRFNVFFKGDDWKGTPQGDRLEKALGAVGVEVVYFPYTVHTSSSALRTALELINQSAWAVASSGTEPGGERAAHRHGGHAWRPGPLRRLRNRDRGNRPAPRATRPPRHRLLPRRGGRTRTSPPSTWAWSWSTSPRCANGPWRR